MTPLGKRYIHVRGEYPQQSNPPPLIPRAAEPQMNDYATHQRFLLRAALNTKGWILELGCGWFSTPLLHEIAVSQERRVHTEDNDPIWLELIRPNFQHPLHSWRCPIAREFLKGRWGLAFVDHGPTPETPRNEKGLLNGLDRAQAVLDLMGCVDVFVLHDTQKSVRWEYDWDEILPLFKYSITDDTHSAHTTIASNVVDVTGASWR